MDRVSSVSSSCFSATDRYAGSTPAVSSNARPITRAAVSSGCSNGLGMVVIRERLEATTDSPTCEKPLVHKGKQSFLTYDNAAESAGSGAVGQPPAIASKTSGSARSRSAGRNASQ
jgi:hypothetical protein